MERFWNIIHYFVYKADYRFHLLFNKINPVLYFYKLPFAKRHFEKMGIDPTVELDKAFKRPDIGISSIIAGGFMLVFLFLFFLGLEDMYVVLTDKSLDLSLTRIILLMSVSILINHLLLFRKDKYLYYFREFEKMEKADRRKWAWISFVVIAIGLIFSIGSIALRMSYHL